jgi:hypothetical protein
MSSDGLTFLVCQGCELSYTRVNGSGAQFSNETISDWGGFHTAAPNSTVPSLYAHHNVFANFARHARVWVGWWYEAGQVREK